MEEKIYQIALTQVPGVGAVTAKNLIRHFGSARAVFEAGPNKRGEVNGVGTRVLRNLRDPAVLERAQKAWGAMCEHQVRLVSFLDAAYPEKLRSQHDSPAFLFLQGEIDLNASRVVAVVGTRRPTERGLETCRRLIEELRPYGVTILSGLAYGVDICAHRAALEADLPTWGALAHGHGDIYPAAHRKVARRMCDRGGLISEYAFYTRAEKEFFPMRNRIVAGLCDALVVIETAKRGGSMITAQLANSYDRDVFAIPGRIDDGPSRGCNHLIKTHRAGLIEEAADLAYLLGWSLPGGIKAVQQELFANLSEEEKIIVDLLRDQEALSRDQILYRIPEGGAWLSNTLLTLEFKGLLKSLPGQRFKLK